METEIKQIFEKRGCKLITFVNRTIPIEYECKCGTKKKKTLRDFKRRGCRECNSKKNNYEKKEYTILETGEIWKPIKGGWISSFGNCKNDDNIFLKLCKSKGRFYIDGKNQYASRLVASAFKIEGYEKLDTQSYCASHIDGDIFNNKLDNIRIISKVEIGEKNGLKSRQSDSFNEKMSWPVNYFDHLAYKKITEFPEYKIYSNGEIWNEEAGRFLTFSQTEGYLNISRKDGTQKVHRIVCFAFNPLPGKYFLKEYDSLQVNHINKNKMDNRKDNLEWVSQSENQLHRYRNASIIQDEKKEEKGENEVKKIKEANHKYVVQLDKNNNYIAHYPSIKEASEKSGEPEHRISTLSRGKKNSNAKYNWEFLYSITEKFKYFFIKIEGVEVGFPFENNNPDLIKNERIKILEKMNKDKPVPNLKNEIN
jgi:hypothetical protein